MKRFSYFLFLTLLILFSCKEDPEPVEIAQNGDLETGTVYPAYWVASTTAGFEMGWTDQASSSPSKSLTISRATSHPTDFTFWAQHLCDNVPIGKNIDLSVRIKGNLTGAGVSIALRADPENMASSDMKFVSTQGQVAITGTFDWQTFQVTMTDVPAATDCLYIFLVYLPGTTGEAYFDDVSLLAQ